MNPGFDFRHIGQEIVFIIIVHMIVPIALKMLDRLSTNRQTILLLALSLFATYFWMGVTHFTFFFMYTNKLTLRQVSDPLGFVLADPHIVMFIDVLVDFEACDEGEYEGEQGQFFGMIHVGKMAIGYGKVVELDFEIINVNQLFINLIWTIELQQKVGFIGMNEQILCKLLSQKQTTDSFELTQAFNQQNQQKQKIPDEMRPSSKSQHIPQKSKDQAASLNDLMHQTKTQSPEIYNLKLPAETQEQKQKNISLSRKMYIVTDQDEQGIESIPTAKHTFMSEKVEMKGENFDGFYTSRNKDQQKEGIIDSQKQGGISKEKGNKGKASVHAKSQRSRFYYKAEEYDQLNGLKSSPKVQDVTKGHQIQTAPKEKSAQKQLQTQMNAKKKPLNQQGAAKNQQTPKPNDRMLSSYISKINESEQPYVRLLQQQGSPFGKKHPGKEEWPYSTQQPKSSRFTQANSGPALQQSHQQLFNKCYKETYTHLKLMLSEVHQSQEKIYILHKQITDTVFQVIKQRAEAIRQEMHQLVENIVTQWMKDEWEFIKTNEIKFIDDVLELQHQLNQRQQEIRSFVDKLLKENANFQTQNQGQQIFQTFNAKRSARTSMKSAKTQTTWKKVTTDLLMFNYENNIIEIQEMIDNLSNKSLDKCNKALDMLPSSKLFAANVHEEVLNTRAKNWFKQSVLEFMNKATLPKKHSTPKDNQKSSLTKTYEIKLSPPRTPARTASKQYEQYQSINNSLRGYQNPSANRPQRSPTQQPPKGLVEWARRQERQKGSSNQKIRLNNMYFGSGRGSPYH